MPLETLPLDHIDDKDHRRMIAGTVNRLIQGDRLGIFKITLDADASTTITDPTGDMFGGTDDWCMFLEPAAAYGSFQDIWGIDYSTVGQVTISHTNKGATRDYWAVVFRMGN